MSLPPYTEYRKTGVGWLGDIPSHWAVDRLKHSVERVQRPFSEDAETVTVFRDGVVTRRSNRRTDGFTEADQYIGYQGIDAGDLAIHAMDGFAGAIGVADSSGKCSPVVSVCRANKYSVAEYYAHVLRHVARSGYLTAIAKGIRERSTDFRWSDARDLSVPMPPYREQQEIVAFLDRETAKIDALIARQEQLIATLREDRTATITHAVTKGLDPSVQMVDTGMAWFGSIPAHWIVRPLGLVARLVQTGPFGSQLHSTDYVHGAVPIVNPSHISERGIEPNHVQTVSVEKATELSRHQLRVGDMVAARRGDLGRCAIAGAQEAGYICGTGSVLVRPDETMVVSDFLQLAFSSFGNRQRLSQISEGSTMDNLNAGMVARLRMCFPPLLEQQQIVDFVGVRSRAIDELVGKAEQVIETLREYRSALITDAVTGKIDVRGAA